MKEYLTKTNSLKLLGYALAGIGFLVARKVDEAQMDEKIREALDERGLVAEPDDLYEQ